MAKLPASVAEYDQEILEREAHTLLKTNLALYHTSRFIFLYPPVVEDEAFLAYGLYVPGDAEDRWKYEARCTIFLLPRGYKRDKKQHLLCYHNVPYNIILNYVSKPKISKSKITTELLSQLHNKVLLPQYRLEKIPFFDGFEVDGKRRYFIPMFEFNYSCETLFRLGYYTGRPGSARLRYKRFQQEARTAPKTMIEIVSDMLRHIISHDGSPVRVSSEAGRKFIYPEGLYVSSGLKNNVTPLIHCFDGTIDPITPDMVAGIHAAGYRIFPVHTKVK